MKKALCLALILLPALTFADDFKYKIPCTFKIKDPKCGIAPEQTTLSFHGYDLQNYTTLKLGDIVFTYDVDADRSKSTDQTDVVAVFGSSSGGRHIYCTYTGYEQLPAKSEFLIWLANKPIDIKKPDEACLYSCKN